MAAITFPPSQRVGAVDDGTPQADLAASQLAANFIRIVRNYSGELARVDGVYPQLNLDVPIEDLIAHARNARGATAVTNQAVESSGTITNTIPASGDAGQEIQAWGALLTFSLDINQTTPRQTPVQIVWCPASENTGFARTSFDTALYTPLTETSRFVIKSAPGPGSSLTLLYIFATNRNGINAPQYALVRKTIAQTGTEVADSTLVVTSTTASGNAMSCTVELLFPGVQMHYEAINALRSAGK